MPTLVPATDDNLSLSNPSLMDCDNTMTVLVSSTLIFMRWVNDFSFKHSFLVVFFILILSHHQYLLRWIFRKLEEVVGTGWSWLRIGTGGGHLWVR
jgi:hypothetical protein